MKMAGVNVEAGSELAQSIQNAVQPKLMECGWVAEENDTTLSEYVTMMIINGKDLQGVTSELGGDLLGIGEDDPAVGSFAEWLFQQVRMLASTAQQQHGHNVEMQQVQSEPQQQQISSVQDAQMDDVAQADGVPSGPKAMRHGGIAGRGRGGRMLGQINSHMGRQDFSDPLRKIKGATGGHSGRINAHAGRDPPRGPKNQAAINGVQRMMNGGPRVGRQNGAPMNPMMQQAGVMNGLPPDQQMAFMQMMEIQANLMNQMMTGQFQPGQQNGHGKSMFERVDNNGKPGHPKNRHQNSHKPHSNGDAGSSMDVDSEGKRKEPFEVLCRFNANCTNPDCPYAHQSPAAPPGQTIDMTDTCSFGGACENRKCAGRHPSPAKRTQHLKQEVDCKFYPNCTNPNCPFRHPEMPLCRNGADCNVSGCQFTHSKIMCRYTPCQRPFCPFKHVEGQRGVFKDKVWTKDGAPNAEDEQEFSAAEEDKSNRFAAFKENESQPEELIIPGRDQSSNSQMDGGTGIIT